MAILDPNIPLNQDVDVDVDVTRPGLAQILFYTHYEITLSHPLRLFR